MRAWCGDGTVVAPFGGTVARIQVPHARAVPFPRGHRFAADPQCYANAVRSGLKGLTLHTYTV